MSDVITTHLDALRASLSEHELSLLQAADPRDKAKGNIDRLFRLAGETGGFVAYFVLNDVGNGGFHDEQHALFCQELGIEEEPYPRAYPLASTALSTTVLRRQVEMHEDEVVSGVHYFVEQIVHDGI